MVKLPNLNFILFLFTALLTILPPLALAQNNAYTYQITDTEAVNGDILSMNEQGLVRVSTSYDKNLFGVLQEYPVAVVLTPDITKKPVITSGVAKVNVTTMNGPVQVGDLITSSTNSGKGQKATISGYVLGKALENYTEQDPQAVGQITVSIRIEFAELTTPRSATSLLQNLFVNILRGIETPQSFEQAIRISLAILVVLFGLIIALLILLRSIPKSVEAIGRNPLARRTIQITMIFVSILAITVIIITLIASFIILRL